MLRDRSHACVITWSLGNESSHGRNIDAAARWVRETDPSRPVQYESCGGGDATDIIAPMCVPPPALPEQPWSHFPPFCFPHPPTKRWAWRDGSGLGGCGGVADRPGEEDVGHMIIEKRRMGEGRGVSD